jgi:hypothetical protein
MDGKPVPAKPGGRCMDNIFVGRLTTINSVSDG